MDTLTISLPTPLKEFIDAQVAAGVTPTPSDFIATLVREEQKRKAHAKVEALLSEGLRSESREMTREEWDAIRREGVEQLTAKRKSP
jgi:antitoxin ParD1/3/4